MILVSTTYLHKMSHKTHTGNRDKEQQRQYFVLISICHGISRHLAAMSLHNWTNCLILIGQMCEIQESDNHNNVTVKIQFSICQRRRQQHCHFPPGRLTQDIHNDGRHFLQISGGDDCLLRLLRLQSFQTPSGLFWGDDVGASAAVHLGSLNPEGSVCSKERNRER